MIGGGLAMDRRYMRRALALAGRGWGRVHPNPLVGAVVVRDGVVVGAGFHAEFGGDHAEVAALRAAGGSANGATLYTTLEPCNHRGKTPPCTEAVLAAGIARVVYGATDPHQQARGGGERLREAGLDVLGGVGEDEVRRQNAAFFHAIERGSAYVALKYGLTLDARLARRPGESTNITGAAARAEVHRLRAGFDAVLVGSATARVDDPWLTVRGGTRPRTPPVRIVLDTEAQLELGSRLVRTVSEAPLWLFCAMDAEAARQAALTGAGVRVLPVRRGAGGLDVRAVLDRAWAEGVRSILCEGGGRVGAGLLAAELVQRMYLFYAPTLFGEGGVPAFPWSAGGAAGSNPTQVPAPWQLVDLRRMGEDALLVLDRKG